MTKKILLLFSMCSTVSLFSSTEPLEPYLETLSEQQAPTEDIILDTDNNTLIEDETQNASIEKPNEVPLENRVEEEIVPQEVVPVHSKIDLPYSEHALIDKYRREYMSNFGKQRLASIMTKASVYRPHIRQTLSEAEIPLALEFLPVIESDFNVTAMSRSGAAGIWQFMENSIAGLLDKNEWIDERYDPWLSTEAAAKKLKYNYSVLKDWELALAAYNMGLGGLQRVMRNAGSDDFWYLADNGYLPSQTAHYVPKFIAVADLISNAEYYGIQLPPYDQNAAVDFTVITVNKQLNLEVLAELTNIEYETYKFLNPAFEYAITPPREYALRIPTEAQEIVLEAIDKQDSTSFLESHRVVQGETLWSLSRKYNTTVEVLCEINNRSQDSILSIGTVLFLPILK